MTPGMILQQLMDLKMWKGFSSRLGAAGETRVHQNDSSAPKKNGPIFDQSTFMVDIEARYIFHFW